MNISSSVKLFFFLSYLKPILDDTRTSQSNEYIILVIEILDTEVEVDREKDIIGTKIIIDVIVEIKVSRDLIFDNL